MGKHSTQALCQQTIDFNWSVTQDGVQGSVGSKSDKEGENVLKHLPHMAMDNVNVTTLNIEPKLSQLRSFLMYCKFC